MNNIKVIVFDLGGVLVELVGVPTMLEWTQNRFNTDELWEAWLKSSAVRTFESGGSSASQFAIDLISEMELSVTPEEFIPAFTNWPRGLYPGVSELLEKLRNNFTLVSLSNTNELHWPRLMNEMGLSDKFTQHFPSHLTGKLKPDLDAFKYVLETMKQDADKILFLDDNEVNVQGALKLGMKSETVKGIKEVEKYLTDTGLIT